MRRGINDPGRASREAPNMTPMIDVVFQLIIFLMLANDLTRKDIEELRLPEADHAVEDPGEEGDRIIVNLLKGRDGGPPSLRVRGREYDLAGFRRLLEPRAGRVREPGEPRASELSVLIRADREARWQDVQYVMQACADPGIRVYRLQFATEDPRGPDGGGHREGR